MTFSPKTEKGVSSCGGRAVRRIKGRFWGYCTRGRSPFSKGKVMPSAPAFQCDDAIAAKALTRNFRRLHRPVHGFRYIVRALADVSRLRGLGYTRGREICQGKSLWVPQCDIQCFQNRG